MKIESILVSLGITLVHVYTVNDPWISLPVFLVNVVCWHTFFKQYDGIHRHYKWLYQMYFYMHSIITTLAIKKHVHESVLDVTVALSHHDKTIQDVMDSDGLTTLTNLKANYPAKIYDLFVSSIQFYDQQGGDVMSLFDNFLRQSRISETRIQEEEHIYRRGVIEFTTLWLFNLLVLLLAKWALRYMFDQMLSNLLVLLSISAVFIWLPLTFLYYQARYQRFSYMKDQ